MKRGSPLRRTPLRKGRPLTRGNTLRSRQSLGTRKNRQQGRPAEEAIAETYQRVTGEMMILQPGSGNRWHKPGDGISQRHLMESKSFGSSIAVLKRRDLEIHWDHAARLSRIPLFVLTIDGQQWAVVDSRLAPTPHDELHAKYTQITLHSHSLMRGYVQAKEKQVPFCVRLCFEGSAQEYCIMALDEYLQLEGERD